VLSWFADPLVAGRRGVRERRRGDRGVYPAVWGEREEKGKEDVISF